jgi:hypothetical protein
MVVQLANRSGLGATSRRVFSAAGVLLKKALDSSKGTVAFKIVLVSLIASMISSCAIGTASTRQGPQHPYDSAAPANADDLLVVNCLLPGQIRRLGQTAVFVGARRPIKTTAVDCAIRGGEYVAYDRSSYETARNIWLSLAEKGDKEAQNYLGEIYEKGLGIEPNYAAAAEWYRRAAEQGQASAQINIGKLFETGLGVPKDMNQALQWYRRASGLPDLQPAPELQPEIQSDKSTGPTIQLIEPVAPRTRGIVRVSLKQGISMIVGRVRAPAGLLSLTINERDTPVANNGIFQTRVSVEEQKSAVSIVAIDKTGQRAERVFSIEPVKRSVASPNFGNYHALVIGNNKYKYLPRLVTAQSDAKTVAEVLERKYGFKVTALYDASRYEILNTLNRLRKTLTEKDNLLIYYGGHGDLDKENDRGHWLPVDAEPESTATWISNTALTDILNIMSAKHVLVVADSCYSGALTRSVLTQLRPGQTDEVRSAYYQAVLDKRSRTALTSGGLAPVLDAGSGGHSVFAGAFIDILRSNQGVLEGQRLFLELVERVTQAAGKRQGFEQVPQYAPIKFAGHEAGDFFLVPSG